MNINVSLIAVKWILKKKLWSILSWKINEISFIYSFNTFDHKKLPESSCEKSRECVCVSAAVWIALRGGA